MLKIVNRNCAGIDVHKKIIVVTIAQNNLIVWLKLSKL